MAAIGAIATGPVLAQGLPGLDTEPPEAADWFGETLADRDLEVQEDCVGSFDLLRAEGTGLTAGGWAWNSEAEAVPEIVLFVDGDSEIVGYGTSGVDRPDVEALPQVTAEDSGWSGTIEMDELPENGLAAYVLLDDAGCLLGDKTALDD